jgi:phosphoglycerate dehydrogenase-like enzyme
VKIIISTVAFSTNKILVNELKKYFQDVIINEKGIRIPENELVNYYKDADAIIVGLEKITSQILDQLPNLKIIAKYGVGMDNIDIEACNKRNIKIGWTGGVNKRSVAEMVLGFMLALCRNLYTTSNQLKNGIWNKNGGIQLTGKTIGIIGVGNIGKELIKILAPFNCKILVNDIIDLKNIENNMVKRVEKETIFLESDLISIHVPLNSETLDLINLDVFKKMKKTAYLINTSRGGVVNENDLKFALKNDIIAGAALDVYDTEPPNDIELLELPNLICTPHTGGNANEAVLDMGLSAIEHLKFFSNKYFNK